MGEIDAKVYLPNALTVAVDPLLGPRVRSYAPDGMLLIDFATTAERALHLAELLVRAAVQFDPTMDVEKWKRGK